MSHGDCAQASAVLVLVLAASLCPPAAAEPRMPIVQGTPGTVQKPPSLHSSGSASASGLGSAAPAGSLECDALIDAGGAVIRLWALQSYEVELSPMPLPSSEAGLAVSLPYLRFGSTKPAGLLAFVHAPASAGTLLLGQSGAPLVLDDPSDPACLGISLGEDYGVFASAPAGAEVLLDVERTAAGAWFSPRGGLLSTLALVSGSHAESGGAGWYDVPVPASRRAFAALSGAAAGTGWAMAGAAAGSLGFPGQDAAACRAEARVSAGGLRLGAEASAASEAWAGPDGRSAPFLRIAADARYARFGYAAVLGLRYVQSGAAGTEAGASGTDVTWSGALEARGWFGKARASASLEAATAAVVEVDTRWRPDFAPWLALASSWRASDGESERFDLSGQASFGAIIRFSIDSGLRFVPEGQLVKGSLSIARTLGVVWVGCSVRTLGWVEPDAAWLDSLVYSMNVSVTLK